MDKPVRCRQRTMDTTRGVMCYWIVVQFLLMFCVRGDIDICEKGKPADVVFILDASNSIWNPDFEEQLRFVGEVIDYFPIGEAHIKVAAATFSDDVYPHFSLNQFFHKADVKDGIADIMQDMGGYTRTYEAIKFMREEMMRRENGARDGIFKIGIVITDGRSDDTEKTEYQARLAKEAGIHMFAIGVGHHVDMEELKAIASEPTHHYRFLVDSYRGLQRIIKFLAIKACTVTDPPPTTTTVSTTPTTPTTPSTTQPTTTKAAHKIKFESRPRELYQLTTPGGPQELRRNPNGIFNGPNSGDPDGNGNPYDGLGTNNGDIFEMDGCIPHQPMDLTFVIDAKQGGSQHKKKIWKFVRNVVSNLDVNNGDVKINFVHDCFHVPGFQLNDHSTRNAVLAAFKSNITSKTTGELLDTMTNKLGEPNENTIVQRKKVGIFVTDGDSGGLENTLRAAQNAKLGNDIELYGVGITDDVNDVELKALVSCPVENHLHLVPSHSKLKSIHKMLTRGLCIGEKSLKM